MNIENPIPIPTPIYDTYIIISVIAYILIIFILLLIYLKMCEKYEQR